MVSVIILAGGKIKEGIQLKILKQYYKLFYGETYLWGKYKPLKLIKINKINTINIKLNFLSKVKLKRKKLIIKKYMIDLVINNIAKSKYIDDVIVVGEKERFMLTVAKNKYPKKVTYIQQVGGLLENAAEGYKNSISGKKKDFALFIPCDIPKAKTEDYNEFILKCNALKKKYNLMFAVIGKENIKGKGKIFRRPFFWCIDDYWKKKPKRRGFRVANMIFAKPDKINGLDKVNHIYSLRKLKEPINAISVIKEVLPEFILYLKHKLTISHINNSVSKYLKTKFSLVEVKSISTTLDVDSDEDYKEINNLRD
jgi:hypothetical protein